jgi:hypothetical protein
VGLREVMSNLEGLKKINTPNASEIDSVFYGVYRQRNDLAKMMNDVAIEASNLEFERK